MEALRSSSTSKLFTENRAFSSSSSSSSSRALSTKLKILFLPTQKPNNNVDSSFSMSLKCKPIEPISYSQAAGVGIVQAVTEEAGHPETVHVRFQLHKECLFGQQFFMVGDDPIFGVWDPEHAIPLDWSEGHIWTVELDIPIGKTVNFKFLLKGTELDVVWQPGPDRILQTWETNNTIIVSEDWDCAEFQNIREEPLAKTLEDVINDAVDELHGSVITENIKEPDTELNKEVIAAENKTTSEGKGLTNENGKPVFVENVFRSNGLAVSKEKPAEKQDNENLVGYEGAPVLVPGLTEHNKNFVSYEREPVLVPGLMEHNKNLVRYEREHVLVPGLTSSSLLTTEEVSIKETRGSGISDSSTVADKSGGGISDTSTVADKSEGDNGHEQNGSRNTKQEERIVTMFNDDGVKEEQNPIGFEEEKPHLIEEQEKPDFQSADGDVLGNDVQWADNLVKDIEWGRNTMHKLLEMLGFPLQAD